MAKKYDATADEIAFYEGDAEEISPTTSTTTPQSSADIVGFYESQPSTPLGDNVPWYKSYPAAAVKSVVNGLVNFGQAFGPLREDPYAKIGEFLNQNQETGISYEEFSKQNKQLPLSQVLNEYLPSNEGFVENTLERAGNILPFLLTGNPAAAEGSLMGAVTRSVLGGASGALAEQYGAPEWAQSLAELPAQVAPGFGGRINPNANQRELVEGARLIGLTEKEITPLIQDPRKQRLISKISSRRGQTEEALSNSYDALKRVYGDLSSRPEAKKVLNQFQAQRVAVDIEEKLAGMPAELRNKISEDFSDLLAGEMTGQKLINFYQDINYYAGRGDRQLGILKEPITKALGQLSPSLAQDFNITNRLYSNYHEIAKNLKPNVASDLMSATEGTVLLFSAFTGNFPLLSSTIGEVAARRMASQLLVNPRFQNLSKQMVNALNQNKGAVAERIYNSMLDLARDVDPESAVYLQRANFKNPQREATQ